ncbi:unnamed protein product [Urochloa humidicola]
MEGLSDLDFGPGRDLQKVILDLFSSSVSYSASPSSHEFWLVASFGRSAIRLNVDSIGLILQAVLGGYAKDFRVIL